MNVRMTQKQVRDAILTRIRQAYREIIAAEKRLSGKLSDNKHKEWSLRLGDAVKALKFAFDELPEVQCVPVDMGPRDFAKLLIEEPKSPRFLAQQTDFLQEARELCDTPTT